MMLRSFHVQAVATPQNTLWQMGKVMDQSKKGKAIKVNNTQLISRAQVGACLGEKDV